MSQITLQGKQQALMRVAASRVAVLDAAASTRQHADRCLRSLPVSPSTIMKIAASAGAAATVMGTLAGLRRRRKAAEKKAAAKSSPAGQTLQLLWQLLVPSLLPVLQKMLQKRLDTPANGGHSSTF